MNSAKIVRPIDTNGRVVLPKNLITDILKVNAEEHVFVQISYTEDSIIIKRNQDTCSFCDCRDELKEYKGIKICAECIKKISKI